MTSPHDQPPAHWGVRAVLAVLLVVTTSVAGAALVTLTVDYWRADLWPRLTQVWER